MSGKSDTAKPLSSKPSSAEAAARKARRRGMERTAAKNAMMASMGALVLTGYLAARGGRRDTASSRLWHMVAGVGLLGTTYWHHTLYGRGEAVARQPAPRSKVTEDRPKPLVKVVGA
ncbi:hypothetical protein [Roseospirillum parvum]|uniref:Uncharacterized protein n=1 Tax=Roseospirillum parvum TaxID=83401 RepID=A0A1G7UPT6_9PROT|nr:hypothetical protein [Roseospirillum parvum]SDG49497.1 hypothetical protein SAMN05421742_101396 [Roseospirillum parvum]